MPENTVESMVTEMKSPAKFKILDVIKDRAYPTENIDVFIDEELAYAAAMLEEEIARLNNEADKSVLNPEELEALIEKREKIIAEKDELMKQIGGTVYTFTITGISEGKRDDMLKLANDKYPIEYRTDSNAFTGEKTRQEIESPERNKLFTEMLWQAHITRITAPDGSVQDGISIEDAQELRRSLPIATIGKLTEAIEKLRVTTAVFMMTVDEDFLAKS